MYFLRALIILSGHMCLKAHLLLRASVKSFMLVGIVLIFLLRSFGSLKRRWKYASLLGRLLKEKSQTEDALKRRNFDGQSRCSMCREEEGMRTISLFIVVGHRLFGIYLFPWWVLVGCNPMCTLFCQRCGGGLEKKMKNNWVSGAWSMIHLAILWHLEEKGWMNFWGQSLVLSKFQALLFETLV